MKTLKIFALVLTNGLKIIQARRSNTIGIKNLVFLWVFVYSLFIGGNVFSANLAKCVGPLCIDDEGGYNKTKAHFGMVEINTGRRYDDGKILCGSTKNGYSVILHYHGDQDSGTTILGSIGIIRLNMCNRTKIFSSDVNHQITIDNLMQMHRSDVLAAKGAPTAIVDVRKREEKNKRYLTTLGSSKFGKECWIYSDTDFASLLGNQVCFDDDVVKSIWIHNSP